MVFLGFMSMLLFIKNLVSICATFFMSFLDFARNNRSLQYARTEILLLLNFVLYPRFAFLILTRMEFMT